MLSPAKNEPNREEISFFLFFFPVAVCNTSLLDPVTINCILIDSRVRFSCLCITISDVYRMLTKRNSETSRSSEQK